MAILKLYGASQAWCTRRLATVLHELKVPFELIEVKLKEGEHKTPAYLEKQPFGQIPYIDDNGFILYETRAICRYIAAKHPESGLIPTDPKANAIFEQAAAAEVSNFDPSASAIGMEAVLKPFQKVKGDQAIIDEQTAILDKKLDAYNAILGKQRYLAGDALTLADLFHLPYAPLLATGGSDIMTSKPNVARWYKELVARPSWLAYLDGVKSTAAY
ncbi:glutathione S-transferase [Mycena rebaudengoi]|nr:glutathione S-transferase [Mycena rebaudengoi]KAJ7238003.1 glutathione S-transferase [Mycena rebaudengoi]